MMMCGKKVLWVSVVDDFSKKVLLISMVDLFLKVFGFRLMIFWIGWQS
jgi:hypothetical protein